MSGRIYKLKEWLTIEDTAKRLSIELEEDIDVSDILQLAMDEQLRISVHFPHDWYGKVCDLTTNVEKVKCDYYDTVSLDGITPVRVYNYEKCSENEYIKVLPNIYCFPSGIYEVKMIGNSKIDVEFQFKIAKGLVAEDVISLNGFYVFDKNRLIIERQEKSNEKSDSHFYYPCPSIDAIKGAFFVIKTNHIDEFLHSLASDVSPTPLKNESTETQSNVIQELYEKIAQLNS